MILRRKHFVEEILPYETFNIHVKVFRKYVIYKKKKNK